ncbi:MAG: long-chain-fatty-acid--CoA ligase [Beijerinckiaceae bacterium]
MLATADLALSQDRNEGGASVPLTQLLDDAVDRFADRPATDFFGSRLTYGELGHLVTRAARGFQMLGVRQGTRVGICLPNTPYYVICYFAILKAGGTVVNFNPLYVDRELEHQIEDSCTKIMVTLDLERIYPKIARTLDRTCLERIVVCSMRSVLPFPKGVLFALFKSAELAKIPDDLRHVSFVRLIADPSALRPVEIDPQKDLAVLQYTGGTTGTPKGAMLTHANLLANVRQIVASAPSLVAGQERALLILPLFHVFAMTVGMNLCIAIGAEIILLPRFDVAEVLATIQKLKPTLFPGVPTIYTALNAAAGQGKHDLSSIRFCNSGGAPLPVEVCARFEHLTGCKLVEGYGLTEASPVVSSNRFDGEIKAASVGPAMLDTVIEIRSLDEPQRILPVGEKGEVCVRGPQVMAGYWNRPADTDAVFIDGALRTGDVGYLDKDGYLFLVDRIKDVILCSGYNVYPRIIEEALYQHPAVAEAVVIGISDAYRGQAPKAFATLRANTSVTADELLQFLKDYVSPIEMPKVIEIRASLPKTAVGKLDRKVLTQEEQGRNEAAA